MVNTVSDFRSFASGSTRLAAVIGDPVRHSLSPVLLNAAFAEAELDWAFLAFEVADGDAGKALDGIRALGFTGLSVTMPHKAAVAALVDHSSEDVKALGAANCVVIEEDGILIAHNTDGEGFLDGLEHDTGMKATGLKSVVFGAGGAAKAVVRALAEAGAAEIWVVNRTLEKARVAATLAGDIGQIIDADEVVEVIKAADLVVNATPVGMSSNRDNTEVMPVDPGLLTTSQVAVDLIYSPLETPWLVELRRRGIEAHGGLSMLIFQAARSFAHWTGLAAPVEAMNSAVRSVLQSR